MTAKSMSPSACLRRAAANTRPAPARPVTVARGWLSAGDRPPPEGNGPVSRPGSVGSRSVLENMPGTNRKRRVDATVTAAGFGLFGSIRRRWVADGSQ